MRRNNIFGQKMVSCITLNAQWLLRESWSSCLFASAIFKVTPSYWRYLVQLCFRKVSTVSIQKFTQEIHRPIGFQQHRCKALGPVDLTSMPCIWHLSGLCNTSPWKCTIQTGKQNCFTALKKFNPKTSIARKKKKHPSLFDGTTYLMFLVTTVWNRWFYPYKKKSKKLTSPSFRPNVKTYGQNH